MGWSPKRAILENYYYYYYYYYYYFYYLFLFLIFLILSFFFNFQIYSYTCNPLYVILINSIYSDFLSIYM